MYINREEAVKILNLFLRANLLDEHIQDYLIDIINCIEAEDKGINLWGADNDAAILFMSPKSDLLDNDDFLKLQKETFEKYKIKEWSGAIERPNGEI